MSEPKAGSLTRTANRLLDALPDADRRRLAPRLTLRRFRAGDALAPADLLAYAHFPRSGVFVDRYTSIGGQPICTSTIGSEGMLGLPVWLGAKEHGSDWVAVTAAEAWRVPYMALGGTMTPLLHRLAGARLLELRQSVACQRTHSLEQRTARYLLEIIERTDAPELDLTQDRVAELVGVTRPRITVALERLEDTGAVHRGRGRLLVRDRRRLRADACECYVTIRRIYDAAGIARPGGDGTR